MPSIYNQEQLEEDIKNLIAGKTSKRQLSKERGISIRNLDKKIDELSKTNPQLYNEFVKTCPYRAKQRTDIDFEALAIYILKNNLTLAQAAEKFDVSIRTITRNIKALKKDNPKLVELYDETSIYRKTLRPYPSKISDKIEMLVPGKIVISSRIEDRITRLKELKAIYEERCKTKSNNQAAKSMGWTTTALERAISELPMLERQRDTSQYLKGLKVDVSHNQLQNQADKDCKNQDIVIAKHENNDNDQEL